MGSKRDTPVGASTVGMRIARRCGCRLVLVTLVASAFLCVPADSRAQSSEDDDPPEQTEEEAESPEEDETLPSLTYDEEEELFEPRERVEGGDEDGDGDDLERSRRTEAPLRTMSRQEAKESGFEFGDREEASDRTTGALLAATGGLVVRGLGHWYVEEPRTATTLAVLEGVSIALASSGLVTWFLRRDAGGATAYATTAFHMGAGLFGLTYLLDIVGAVQGGKLRMPANSRGQRGVSLDAGYRFVSARGFPSRHHFRGRVGIDAGTVYGEATTDQDFGLTNSVYAGEIGARYWRGRRRWTFGYVEAGGELLDLRGDGPLNRWRGEIRTGLSVDLGVVAPHLEEVALGAEIGVGREWYVIPSTEEDVGGFGSGRDYVPATVYSHFNVSQRLNARFEYTKRAGDVLQATRRLAGVGAVELNFDSTELFDLQLRGEFGGGIAVTGGLVLWVWE